MLPEELTQLSEKIVRLYAEKKLKLATAESCTGGLVATAITSISGSSAIFERGFVTYSNQAKHEDIGVANTLLEEHGAVSMEIASAMADGARRKANTDVAVAITGIAGPTGGSAEKPVGLVFIGLSSAKGSESRRFMFEGSRDDIRQQATHKALSWLYAAAKEL
jgi:PncC family amidohydrolase